MRRSGEPFASRLIPSWWPAVAAVSRAEPGLAVTAVVTTVVCAAMPAVFIVLSGIAAGLVSGHAGSAGGELAVVVTALAAALALAQIATVAREGVIEALARRMDIVLRRRLIEAIARPAGVAHLEDPATQRRIAVAQGVANRLGGPAGGLLGVAGRAQVLLAGACCAALLGWIEPVLAAVLAPVILIVGWLLRREYLRVVEQLHLDPGVLRRTQYLRDVLVSPGAEKEVQVFGLGRWFAGLHHAEWLSVASAAWRGRRVSWWTIVAGTVIFGVGQAVSFAVLASGWRAGAVTVGGLVIGVQGSIGLLQFAAVTEWDRLAHIGWDAVDALIGIEGTMPPQALSAGASQGNAPVREIEFRHVSFSYPDGTQALHDVSLTITGGGSVALVGPNGAGKSTLLKLLLRHYEPTEGQILADGVPLAELDPVRWRSQVATLAQDFVRLPLSVRENVTGPGAEPLDPSALAGVTAEADLESVIADLPAGWETVLSRQIRGGTDISGGQWQKVALARALYALRAGAQVLALDEPTASMDIEAERDVYDAVINATAQRTLVLVSHRFGTVRRVDRIFVLDAGRVVESGDHETLMDLRGLYARMFELQAAIVR